MCSKDRKDLFIIFLGMVFIVFGIPLIMFYGIHEFTPNLDGSQMVIVENTYCDEVKPASGASINAVSMFGFTSGSIEPTGGNSDPDCYIEVAGEIYKLQGTENHRYKSGNSYCMVLNKGNRIAEVGSGTLFEGSACP